MARIAFFPTPYPDELWYSVLCRYHMRSGNLSYAMTVKQLFGVENTKVSAYYTGNHIVNLLSRLPDGFIGIENIIREHTLFPFVTRFSSVEQRQAVYEYFSSGIGGDKFSSSLRLWPYAEGKIPLRYCPLCNADSQEKFGEYYWHTFHQIRTMPLCPIHKCRLVNSTVFLRSSCRVFEPASCCNCPQTQPNYNCMPYEELLTDTLFAYYSAPVRLECNPSFREFAYSRLVSAGLLPRSSSKIMPTKLRELFIDTVGVDVFNNHFLDSNFRNTIYLVILKEKFTVPNHFALLSTAMKLPADSFLNDQQDENEIKVLLSEMAAKPYIFSKCYVAATIGLEKSCQLDVVAAKLDIEPFWEQLLSKKKGDNTSMKKDYEEIKALLTREEKEMIAEHITELGIASYSEYIRYCIRLELAGFGLELPKRTKEFSNPKAPVTEKPTPKGRKRVSKPDNWDTIIAALRQGSINTGEAMRQSGLYTSRFYAFLRKEPDADAIIAAGRESRKIPYPDNWEEIVNDYEHGRINWTEAVKRSGFTAGTFYNRIKERQNKL